MKYRVLFWAILIGLFFVGCGKIDDDITTDTRTHMIASPSISAEPFMTELPPDTSELSMPFPQAVDFSMSASEQFMVFIYHEEETWAVETFGQFKWQDGYAYVANNKNAIRLLDSKPVKLICDTPNAVFYITEDNRLCLADFLGEYSSEVYSSTRGEITQASRYEHSLCMLEGNYIVCIDLLTQEVMGVYNGENAVDVYQYTQSLIIVQDNQGAYKLLDTSTGEMWMLSPQERDTLTTTVILDPPTGAVADGHPVVTIRLKSAAIKLKDKTVSFVVNTEQLAAIRRIFASAEAVTEEIPDDIVLGPTIILSGIDDYVVSGQVAMAHSLIHIGEKWYDYSSALNGEREHDAVMHMLQLFGLSDWPQWVSDYFNK